MRMARRKQKSSESIHPQCNNGDSSESGRSRDASQVPEKKSCIHINKAVDPNGIRKHFKNPSSNLSKCSTCDANQDLCICLNCGVVVCLAKDALKHEQIPRSEPHCMMLDTSKWTVWCYKCNSGVQLDANKKLRTTVDHVQSHFEKLSSQPMSSVPIPLGPPQPSEKKAEINTSSNKNSLNKKKGNSVGNKQAAAAQPCKVRGLQNLGNTCFFNSVLQCLSQTPNLLDHLYDMKEAGREFTLPPVDEGDEEMKGQLDGWGPLTQVLASTLAEMNSGAQTVYSPRSLLEELRKKCPQFRGYDQHDAHELLRELLCAVRTEDLKRYQKLILLKMYKTTKVDPASVTPERKAKTKRLDNKISELVSTKPIDVFQGKTECVHQCQDCSHSTSKIEPFMDLSLPVLCEKPQPPNSKRNREDSTSEEPKLSKHQLKKMEKQKNKKGGQKGKQKQGNDKDNRKEDKNELESVAPNSSSPDNVVLHTAQAFMNTYSPVKPDYDSFDEDFPAMTGLLDDCDVTAKSLDQTAPQDEVWEEFQSMNEPSPVKKLPASPSHNPDFEMGPSYCEPWPPAGDHWHSSALTVESLKRIETDDIGSRSSSQFHESGFGSQSIDEVSSTHPSEGMCSTESCNGGPSIFGDEFQHIENKTSIPESGIGSMTEEIATLSIIESDVENNSPDSMQANRSSGSNQTLSPYSSGDSSQKQNQLRSCNSLSNLSGEDPSCYRPPPAFDPAYLNEKLLASSRSREVTDADEEERGREYHARDMETLYDGRQRADTLYDQFGVHATDETLYSDSKEYNLADEYSYGNNEGSLNVYDLTSRLNETFTFGPANSSIDSAEGPKEPNNSAESSQSEYLMFVNKEMKASFNEPNESLDSMIESSIVEPNKSSDQSKGSHERSENNAENEGSIHEHKNLLDSNIIEHWGPQLSSVSHRNGSPMNGPHNSNIVEGPLYGPNPKEEEIEDAGEEGDKEEDEGDVVEEKKQEENYEQSSISNGQTLSPRLHGNNGECSLLSCLNQYTCIELLAGNNKVTCDHCTRKHNRGTNRSEPVRTAATLQTLIISPPPVLICHLKRFQLTYHSLKKITKSVPFPMTLSIGSFCSSKCRGINKEQKDVQYSLYGIVEHSGSLHGGHYVAYIKASSTGQWYYASDSRVNPVSEERVLKAEAYLLFYHRIC